MNLRNLASGVQHTVNRRFCMGKPVTLLLITFIGVSFLGLFVGCGGTYPGTRVSQAPMESVENLVYLDSSLTKQIPCEILRAEILASGRTRVYARFMNTRDATAECQIKVKFKDASGRIIDDTGWMPFVLPRSEVAQFEHTSLCTDVKNFTLMLRAAK